MGDCAGMFPQQKKGVPQRETAGDLKRPCSRLSCPIKDVLKEKFQFFHGILLFLFDRNLNG
jgi:hypothetical protein